MAFLMAQIWLWYCFMQPAGMCSGINLTSVVDQGTERLGGRHVTAHRENGSTTQYTLEKEVSKYACMS